jgi:hypothetical protein
MPFKDIYWEKLPGESKKEEALRMERFRNELTKQGYLGSVGVLKMLTPEQAKVKNYRHKLRDYVASSKRFEGIRFIKDPSRIDGSQYWYKREDLPILLEMAVR